VNSLESIKRGPELRVRSIFIQFLMFFTWRTEFLARLVIEILDDLLAISEIDNYGGLGVHLPEFVLRRNSRFHCNNAPNQRTSTPIGTPTAFRSHTHRTIEVARLNNIKTGII